MVARKLRWFDPYDSSPTGYLIMWVEFIVGPCFALREMSDIFGWAIYFREGISMERRGEISETIFAFQKCCVLLFFAKKKY